MKIKLLSVLAPLLVIVSSCVQPEIEVFGSVSGIVKDSQTNKVLEGVKVTLSPGGVSQLTGQDGTFSFEELDQAEYTLSFVKDGYEDESQKVSVKPGLAASVQVGLFPIVPELELSTSVLDYGEELTTLSIDISNKGKGELRWTLTEDIEWLEASVLEGAVTTEKSSVVLTISRAALEEGNYMDSFVISSNGGSETVMVMVGVATVRFEVTPAQADFSTVTNTIQLTLKNLGKKNLEWVAKASKEWVSLSKESGLISKEDYVNVIVSREGLSPGHYDAEIVFVSDGGEISVPVLMDVAVDEKPTVTAESVSGVSYNGAVLHGTVVSVGSDKITKYGFCWSSTNDSPTLEDHFSNLGDCSSPEEFESVVSNLSSDTKYFFRAYAENSVGISYSDKVLTFTTTGLPALPAVTTGSVEEITSSSAKVKGKITSLGNVAAVTAYGHVWSTSPEPTLETGKSTNLGETGAAESFVSELKGLEVATNYYVRAYAVNEKGTAYGDVVTFVTDKTDVKVETSEVKDIVHNAATAGGKIVSYGGHKILERGVCWDDEALPTIEDDFMTSDASGDEWSCRITGLELESTYFVRAYVKTEEGKVFYGKDVQIKTTKVVSVPKLSPVTVSNLQTASVTVVANILSDGNSEITECGFCWSDVAEPTVDDNVVECDPQSSEMGRNLTGLTEGTDYYIRAYAKNAMGIAYSELCTFTTLAVGAPQVSAVTVENIGRTKADVAADIISDGNGTLTDYGFCWSVNPYPTIYDANKVSLHPDVSNGTRVTIMVPSDVEMSTQLIGLPAMTTVYVRAYAVNEKGVSYGEETSFTTVESDTDVWDGVSVADKFGGGVGTEANPIIINTAAQLKLLADNVNNGVSSYYGIYFRLEANINLSKHPWSPIGNGNYPFKGNFNGGNKIISGLFVSGHNTYSGLFGKAEYSILSNVIVSGMVKSTCAYSSYHGGVVGYMNAGTIFNCYNYCEVSYFSQMDDYDTSYVGGICGLAAGVSNLYNCINKGSVVAEISGYRATTYVGGLGGSIYNVHNCMNQADVIGDSGNYIGGICGKGNPSNCVNYKSISNGGGIHGGSDTSISNVYWLYEPANNIGNQGMAPGTTSGTSFMRTETQCLIAPDYMLDLVEQLNSWVSSNSSGVTYKKWKYETVDGYACPVFDEE